MFDLRSLTKLALLALPLGALGQQPVVGFGTVNIILANKNGLVAVVDQMITRGDEHKPSGVKLYKIDDVTICTIAGFYDDRGALGLSAIEASIPSVVAGFATNGPGNAPFKVKLFLLAATLAHRFGMSVQAWLQNVPQTDRGKFMQQLSQQPIELTLAGYGEGGRLEVAAVVLTPRLGTDGVTFDPAPLPLNSSPPVCELQGREDTAPLPAGYESAILLNIPNPRFVGNTWFCEVAGVPQVAEAILDRPPDGPSVSPVIRIYARSEDRRSMSVDQMRSLAIELERQTASNEASTGKFRVGGEPQVAVLSDGKVQEAPVLPPLEPEVGSKLSGAELTNPHLQDCAGGVDITTFRSPGWLDVGVGNGRIIRAKVNLINCVQGLDDVEFHDSNFTNSTLKYFGRGLLLFDPSNQVENSALELVDVDPTRDDVKRLVCGFRWRSIQPDPKIRCDVRVP